MRRVYQNGKNNILLLLKQEADCTAPHIGEVSWAVIGFKNSEKFIDSSFDSRKMASDIYKMLEADAIATGYRLEEEGWKFSQGYKKYC